VKSITLFALATLCSMTALTAQETRPFDAKPGLWETSTTTTVSGLPSMPSMPQLTPEQLAKIPEAQRKQLEAMVNNAASQSSGAGSAGAPRTTTTKTCVTKEQLAKGMAFGDSNNLNCTRKINQSSGSRIEMHMECQEDKMKMTLTGDFAVERLDSEHVKGSGNMKTSGAGASGAMRNVETKFTMTAKFVSSDCGDVKPASDK
jgi:Protein of unknown function (DUF3617)